MNNNQVDSNLNYEYEENLEDDYIPDDEEEVSNNGFLSTINLNTSNFVAPTVTFNISSKQSENTEIESKEIVPPHPEDGLDIIGALSSKFTEDFSSIKELETTADFEESLMAAVKDSSGHKTQSVMEYPSESPENVFSANQISDSPLDNNDIISHSILLVSNSKIHFSEDFVGVGYGELLDLLKTDSDHKEKIQKEISQRLEGVIKDLEDERSKMSSEDNQNINLATPSLSGSHEGKLREKLFRKANNADYRLILADLLFKISEFGQWMKSKTINVINSFFKSSSKGYMIGKSEKPRPTFSLAHLIGVGVVSATIGFSGSDHIEKTVSNSMDYAHIQYENIKNIDVGNYIKIATNYADNAMNSIMSYKDDIKADYNKFNASYDSNIEDSSSLMPSSTFIARSYEHLEGLYKNSSTSNEIMGSVIKDYIGMSSVCVNSNTPLCKITVHPMGTNIINTGIGHEAAANSIVLDAHTGVFEIYDSEGKVSYIEELNTNERKNNWF